VDKGDVKVAVKNALKFKKIYDTFVGKALFIFDEAHVFERDLLSSNTKSVDLSELYKNVQKVFNKLRDLDSLLDFGLSGMSSQARKRAERLMETGDVVLFRLKILKNLMEKTTNWMKDVWSRGEDLDVTDVAHAMMRFFFEEVKSGKDVYEKEALDVLESVWRKALAYEKKDYREVVNEAQKKAEEFLEVLKEEYSSGNGKSPEMGRKILSALLLTAFLEETKSTVQSMVEMISELRKDKNVVDESGVLSFYLYVQKFPKGRCFTIARDLAQISQFLKDHVAYTVAKLRLADADAYKNVAGEGGYLDKTYHPYWRMELYGFNKVNASLAEIKNRVSLDGFVINEIKNDVRGFLEEKLPQWRRLRKIFTSATLTDSGVGRKRKSSPSFNFFFRSVGLRYVDEDDCRTFVVLSPFNYGENALFYLPEDVPPFQEKNGGGASKEWREYVLEKMKEAPFYATGGTLVLLNSKEMLFWFYKELKDYYEKNGVQVLAQGFNSMKEINEKFGKPGAGPQILFSVQLYWQGFDVPGEGLQHVIIPKLPFEEPRSPYNVMVVEREVDRIAEFLMTKRNLPPLKAMEIATRSAFKSIVVPRAVLFFRQGIGRLIRTESDKGLVTLLDDRIVTKNYGKFFAKVIPMKYTRSFREVERFLDRHGIKGPYWGESGGRRVAIAMGMGR
jgi:Rad3-related DNA helicase